MLSSDLMQTVSSLSVNAWQSDCCCLWGTLRSGSFKWLFYEWAEDDPRRSMCGRQLQADAECRGEKTRTKIHWYANRERDGMIKTSKNSPILKCLSSFIFSEGWSQVISTRKDFIQWICQTKFYRFEFCCRMKQRPDCRWETFWWSEGLWTSRCSFQTSIVQSVWALIYKSLKILRIDITKTLNFTS